MSRRETDCADAALPAAGKMKKIIFSTLRGLLSLALVAWLGYYLYANWDLFSASADVSRYHLAALAVCILATWVINSLQVLLLLRMEHIHVGFWENLLVQTATLLANYVPMRIGTILRFRYFKKVHGLEYTRLGGIAGLRLLILVSATGLLGTVGLLGYWLSGDLLVNRLLWVLFLGMLCVPAATYLLAIRRFRLPGGRTGVVLGLFLSGFVSIRQQPRVAWFVLGLLLCQFVLLAIRLYISFDALQVQLSPWVLLLLAPTATLFAFLTITPGNLGLREWVIGVLSLAAGYQFDGAVFAGVIDRAVLMGCTFAFGAVGLVYLQLRLNRAGRGNQTAVAGQP
jgi:uncharacterized membrane protein YbhN (UPF0104 family)